MHKDLEKYRKRLFEIIEVGSHYDLPSRAYDLLNTLAILINLTACILYTYDTIRIPYGRLLLVLEQITVAFFCIDYILRLWTAKYLYRKYTPRRALRKYIFSFVGLVDLLSFLPYYLPFFFPSGIVAFRIIRIVRIFRLFRINAYYDSLNVIAAVLSNKKQQLLSSVSIIFIMMLFSSLYMYSLEHEAQPEVFSNAFSGIWWATSTLLTVGYGDIYPITTLGKMFGIFIAFLGVGMVAIPTGIISAGFVDQYSRVKKAADYGREDELCCIPIRLKEEDHWVGKTIADLHLPSGFIPTALHRGDKSMPAGEDTVLFAGDTLILGADRSRSKTRLSLKKIILKRNNPWVGQRIKDLDISRQSRILFIRRQNTRLKPEDQLQLKKFDTVILYTENHEDDD